MKRNCLLLITIIIISILNSCEIKSADEYYSSAASKTSLKASILINCQTAVDYKDSKREKADILKKTEIGFNKGETVFDALKRACKNNKIQLEVKGDGESVYVEGIDYLYEFDCGSLSGWEYSVNGEFPSVGCNAYELKENDEISWLYTCELGADIGDRYEGAEND